MGVGVLGFGSISWALADELPLPTPVGASTPVAQPDMSVMSAEADTSLALRARAALEADPALSGLNLLVSVVNRAVVVGGPVPDEDLIPRVEAVVRKVPGFSDVKVTCFVHAPTDDPLKREILARMKAANAANPLAGLPTLAIGVPRPDPSPSADLPPLTALPRPTVVEASPTAAAEVYAIGDRRPPGTVTVQRVAGGPFPLFLEEPVGPGGVRVTSLPMPATSAAPSAEPTIPPTTVPTAPPAFGNGNGDGIEAAVSNVRSADARFADLTVTVRGGTAVVAGRARKDADAWEFVQAVRKVPGIDRIVLGRVDAR
ncbi:hypothetical protein FRUB_02650 [Fimbriiglobus ruber]|uniref:BON domain-containing protein n=2 Tax=Fimbriiglobus ruber TaxID=1908690 RepID=A0A225DP15_9BACT|nr:hypothetical protein FRUB_02650 [Fimbriiglobus ruber]